MSKLELRPYQEAALRHAVMLADEHVGSPVPQSVMYAAPTGTGKTTCMMSIQAALEAKGHTCVILTPSVEIIRGMLEKIGIELKGRSNAWISKKAREFNVFTPKAYQNRLLGSETREPIDPHDVIIRDEGHEDALGNITTDTILSMAGPALFLAFTATPFRATNRSTARLRELYGDPIVLLTIRDAVANNWMCLPEFIVEPICNDDTIKISGKDFQVSSIFEHYTNELDKSCDLIERVWQDAPTMCSIASKKLVSLIANELEHRGIPYRVVVDKTSGADRGEAYETCQQGKAVLLQISVLTRGVDLPRMRQLIDFRPTLSPVLWMQTIGRVARPGAPAKVFVTNRNLARFSFLLEGLIPAEYIVREQEAFGAPCTRGHARSLGFEAIGKFKPGIVAHDSGGFLTVYAMDRKVKEGTIETFAAIFVPGHDAPITVHRARHFEPTDIYGVVKRTYDRWEPCEIPQDGELEGYASVPKKLTPKQAAWFRKSAHTVGICPPPLATTAIDGRQFACFTILRDLARQRREEKN